MASPGVPIEHAVHRVGEVDLHVASTGPADAPVMVLLHGWPQTWREWLPLAGYLTDFRLVVPDLRGLGESSVPEDPHAGYDKLTLAGDVAGLVRDVLDLERVLVVGHDWGGVVAFYTAWLLGKRARGLAVLDVTVPNDLGAGPDISQGGGRWHHAFHRTSLAEPLVAGDPQRYFEWFYDHLAGTPAAIGPDARAAYVRSYSQPARTRAGFELYRAMETDRANAAKVGAHGIGVPVLALGGDSGWGRGDEPRECLAYFAADVTGGVVAGCGHFVPEERPEVLAEHLRELDARA